MRTRPALLLSCALFLAPSAALYAADAPRPVHPAATAQKPANGGILLDFGPWLRNRAKVLGTPFGSLSKTTSPTAPTPVPMGDCLDALDRNHCPIG